jgi:hypothetical protein
MKYLAATGGQVFFVNKSFPPVAQSIFLYKIVSRHGRHPFFVTKLFPA